MEPKEKSGSSSEVGFGEPEGPGFPCGKEDWELPPPRARSAQSPRPNNRASRLCVSGIRRLDGVGVGGLTCARAASTVGPDLGNPRAGRTHSLPDRPAPGPRRALRSLGCSRNARGWGLPSGAGLAGGAGGGGRGRAATFPEWRGDVRRKGAGRARFKWHSLSSELAAVWAGAGYISGGPGRRRADGDSGGGERLGAAHPHPTQPRSPAPPDGPARPPEERRPGPVRAATTPQQIWIPRPASPRLLPPGGPRRSGRPRRAPPPRRPAPKTPAAPWRPPSPAS